MLGRVDVRPRLRKPRRADEGRRYPGHLKWLRGRPCLIQDKRGHVCSGRMEAAHVDDMGTRGVSLKSPDYSAVPLCSDAHRELHQLGRDTWESRFAVDLTKAAAEYARLSPHRAKWESPHDED